MQFFLVKLIVMTIISFMVAGTVIPERAVQLASSTQALQAVKSMFVSGNSTSPSSMPSVSFSFSFNVSRQPKQLLGEDGEEKEGSKTGDLTEFDVKIGGTFGYELNWSNWARLT